ncbi:MAG: sigma-54-dependent Fis family transcriptional regulator [Fimbriimonadaceae bacterium]|nr:sigma-54-dependent Fis family transcriptional regulator [Chitinophagales bacterium]
MSKGSKVLIIDDDPTFCTMLKGFLLKKEFDVEAVFSGTEGLNEVQKNKYDIVLSDFRLPDVNGLDLLQSIRQDKPALPVIIMTSYADIRIAVQAMKMGAFEYVTKPVNPDEILLTIKNALNAKVGDNVAVTKTTPSPLSNKNKKQSGLIYVEGSSDQSTKIHDHIRLVSPTNISVIIQGESGTGKEYVAKMIHANSKRSENPFISIDCGALSKELAASELFGHVKGSFTGAIHDKTGQFVAADGGTLFLDEIGNLTYDVQVQLLRAIQERRIRKIGGNQDVEVNVRIIVATNEDLGEAVKRGAFREDLYHRLNEFKILVPALRERGDDIIVFAQHFLDLANSELEKDIAGFDAEVLSIFRKYSWPGNLREVRNIVRRSVLLTQGNYIQKETLPYEIVFENRTDVAAHTTNNQSMQTVQTEAPTDLKSLAEKTEREMIINTLIKVNYNKSKAATILKIDRKTLYNKMKQYKILHSEG